MAFGLDYVSGPSPADLKAAGVTFVCRYLSEVNAQTQIKILTPAEAKALSQVGVAIVSNFEWYASRPLEGADAGAADAKLAASQHAQCGGPASRPIYFSVDADVAGSQVLDYFKGVESVIGLARTGAYGSYRVIQSLFNAGAIAWGWQTYAWSGGLWEPRAHIQQYQNSMTLSGASVDYNRSTVADFGQWFVGGLSMVPQGWIPSADGKSLKAPNDVEVVLGFCEYVLANNWDPDNWPLAPEAGRNPLEDSNTGLGGGTFQIFRWTMLEWTPARGVFVSWVGQELLKTRAELDALKAQPPAPVPVDLTALLAAINNIPTAVGQAVGQSTAAAIVEAKKL